MPEQLSVFPPRYSQADDPGLVEGGDNLPLRRGRRPVVFDVVASDQTTSLLPDDLKLVLHVNPRSMQLSYQKVITRMQTRGGFVEFHWGDGAEEITFDTATGGFMRLYTGLSNITAGPQGRRETVAYNKYLDMLSLFHNNGAVYDRFGNIVVQGYIKISFDGGVHIGWFDGDFSIKEDANIPYMFSISSRFIIDREIMNFRYFPNRTFAPEGVAQGGISDDPQPATSTSILNPLLVEGILEQGSTGTPDFSGIPGFGFNPEGGL